MNTTHLLKLFGCLLVTMGAVSGVVWKSGRVEKWQSDSFASGEWRVTR